MSRKRNTYKNKTFFISLFIAGVAVAVLMGVTLVLGAGVQRAHGDISVGYIADNVNCTAQAWYQVSGSNTKTYFTDGNSNSTLSFSASSQAQTKNFISGNVTLNSDHDYCLVTFMFRNNAPAGGDDIRLSLTDSSVKTNIATYYYVRTYTPSVTLSTNYNDAITGSTSVPGPVYIKPGNTIYYEIVIKIADLDYSASYSASSGNGILWLLENSEFSKSYQTVEYLESTGTQYIDTLVAGNNNDYYHFEYDVEYTDTQTRQLMGLGSSTSQWGISYGKFEIGGYVSNIDVSSRDYVEWDFSFFDNIDRLTINKSSTFEVTPPSSVLGFSATVFSWASHYLCYVKLYNHIVCVNGETVRSFIPVVRLSDNEPGLWDSVNEVFYDNDGSGTFNVGPATADFADGFVEVDYIQKTDDDLSYIDSGVIPNGNLKTQIKFRTNSIGKFGFGTRYDTTASWQYYETINYRLFSYDNQWYCDMGYGTMSLGEYGNHRIIGGSVEANTIYELEYGNRYLKNLSDNTIIVSNSALDNINFGYTSEYTIKFFGVQPAVSTTAPDSRIYYVKMYSGDTLIRDFVPVRRSSNNKPGLYDKVTGTFYTNSGTGTDFTLGPDAS